MKIKKNWLQFKEPQAPSTQSAEKWSDEKLSDSSLTNNQDNIEVLPRLNDEESSDEGLSDEGSSDEDDEELSDEGLPDEGSTDEESVDQMQEKFLMEKLKEKGINIPLPFRKRNNSVANNKTGQIIKSVCKSQIIQPKGLTDFLPGIFSDSSSLMAATVGAALVVATCLMKKNYTSVGQTNWWQVY